MTPPDSDSPLRTTLGFARRPELLAFLPALTLAAYWLGGEAALMVTALVVPMIYAGAGILDARAASAGAATAGKGAPSREAVTGQLDTLLLTAETTGRKTACLVVEIDAAAAGARHHGPAVWSDILDLCHARLCGALRQTDTVQRLDTTRFVVTLAPSRRADLESTLQVAERLQSALAEPVSIDRGTAHVTGSIGFCLSSRRPGDGGAALLGAAEQAAQQALHNGPEGLRSFAPEGAAPSGVAYPSREELEQALDNGEIRAFFQPQLSTDTGAVTGFEALARWLHPESGVLLPNAFLPALQQAGLTGRLGELMLRQALNALRDWERSGLHAPRVGGNFSGEELRDPRLADRIEWELDRFAIAPDRFVLEILESVVAGQDDAVIVQNVTRLADLGCGIDLDDFGSGQAAIAGIQRFAVTRIKIDRGFVTRMHQDRERQRMVAGILSLAEQLQLETIAEGVEDSSTHALLAQLGCRHVQGFAISPPLPFEDSLRWAHDHERQLARAPRLDNRIG